MFKSHCKYQIITGLLDIIIYQTSLSAPISLTCIVIYVFELVPHIFMAFLTFTPRTKQRRGHIYFWVVVYMLDPRFPNLYFCMFNQKLKFKRPEKDGAKSPLPLVPMKNLLMLYVTSRREVLSGFKNSRSTRSITNNCRGRQIHSETQMSTQD